MAPRRRTGFDDRGILIDGGGHLPFYAGAMHYWRVDPTAWRPCLRALRAQGLRIVETYVPWRVHATSTTRAGRPGFDFTGARDLRRFLDEAAAADLAVMLRPGPTVNAELTAFGLPDHIVSAPSNLARTASGTPAFFPSPPRAFPIPSYASTTFRAEVRTWFSAVTDVIGPRLAPDGPVVALGIDAHLFHRLGAFDLDYHPDALAWWREDHPDPPRDASDPSLTAAWVRFKDIYLARALAEFSSYLDLGIARCHNLPPTEPFLHDLPRLSAAVAGPAVMSSSSPRTHFTTVRRRALHCAGSSTLPLAEASVGSSPFLPPIADPDHDRDQLLTLLASGIRGFNLYMAVERERFYGAAIDRRGKVEATWIKPLLAALTSVDWPSLRRAMPLALIASRADARFATTLDPMTPVVLDVLGLSELDASPHRRWFAAIEQALSLAAVPYAIVDEGCADFSPYHAVIVPTMDRIDRTLLANLRTAKTVVLGPGTPTRDELDQPLTDPLPKRLGRIRPGSLTDLPSLASDLAALSGPPDHFQIERPASVESSLFHDATHIPRVVFVQSFVDKPVTAILTVPSISLRDPFGDPVSVADGHAHIKLRARGIRMFLIS